jgi:hypothetical protein
MAEHHNKSLVLLQLSISALIVVVIFILLVNPKYNVLLKSRQVIKEDTFDIPQPEWRYDYWSNISASDNYPIVHLRSGYKVIKEKGDRLLVGWKYELVNASSKDRDITIYFKITDSDGFVIGRGSESKLVQKKSYDVFQGTLYVEKDDANRIKGSSWSISIVPKTDLKVKKSTISRFDLAGQVLKEKGPWWLKRYIKYRFDDKESYERGKKEKSKWYRIAKAMNVSYDEELLELRTQLGLDGYDLPPWSQIKEKQEYLQLPKEKKNKLKSWLALQRDFGGYNPQKGRKFALNIKWDFQD